MIRVRDFQPSGSVLLLVAALVVLANAGLAYRASSAFDLSREHAERTRRLAGRTNALLSSLKDAETGQRDFLLSGRDQYLEPYRQASVETPRILHDLEDLIRPGNAGQEFERLRLLVKAKLEELQEAVELRQSRGEGAAVAVVLTDRGKAEMDQIQELCSEMLARSERTSAQYAASAQSASRWLGIVTVAGSVVLFVILVLSAIAIRRGERRQEVPVEDLQKNQELMATFVSHAPAALAMLDRDMRYLELSGRWCSDFHLDAAQVLSLIHI